MIQGLLITCCLFGVWATLCYVVADLVSPAAGDCWVPKCLGTGLISMQSLAAANLRQAARLRRARCFRRRAETVCFEE